MLHASVFSHFLLVCDITSNSRFIFQPSVHRAKNTLVRGGDEQLCGALPAEAFAFRQLPRWPTDRPCDSPPGPWRSPRDRGAEGAGLGSTLAVRGEHLSVLSLVSECRFPRDRHTFLCVHEQARAHLPV